MKGKGFVALGIQVSRMAAPPSIAMWLRAARRMRTSMSADGSADVDDIDHRRRRLEAVLVEDHRLAGGGAIHAEHWPGLLPCVRVDGHFSPRIAHGVSKAAVEVRCDGAA